MTGWRHDFHLHPELGFEEHQTSSKVADLLTDFGLSVHRGIGGTGIVGILENGESTRSIGLRADMDALPIKEENEVPYKSKNEGVMHACGHDVHTSSMLGTILILNNLKHLFGGKIKFIFQPGEEKLPGGASLMIKEGVLEPTPNCCFAQRHSSLWCHTKRVVQNE